MRSCILRCGVLALLATFAAAYASPQTPEQIGDPVFVGNWFVFFNPTKGGGTQQLSVDVNEHGSYIATDMHGELPPVSGVLEAKDGSWTLRGKDGQVIDQGKYELMGPQLQLTGALGKGHWSKVSNESKQAGLANAGDDPKRAALAPLLGEAVKSARTKWQADARLVEVKVIPNDDGTIDLTMAGGNGMLKLYSPSTDKGCIAMIGNFGEVNLYPEERPVSFSKLAIPTNVIELGKAISTARTQERQGMRLREASMYGVGDDLDLRQFCWVLTTDDTVIAIDALTVVECDYRKFMDGRERARKVPFAANETVINFMHTLPPDGLPLMMWQTLHAVHLEGYEEAILVRVPWRVIPEEEMDRHANREGSRIMYRGDTNLYPRGDHAPLTGETLERFMKDEDSIAIQCTPFGVQTVNPLASYPPGTKEKIVKQLEAHWRASGGR